MGMLAKIRQMYFRDKVPLREIARQTGLSRNTLSTGCARARCANLLQGMSRMSCVFCIMASRSDLRTGAQLQPDLYRKYEALERRIGDALSPSRVPLPQLTGIPL